MEPWTANTRTVHFSMPMQLPGVIKKLIGTCSLHSESQNLCLLKYSERAVAARHNTCHIVSKQLSGVAVTLAVSHFLGLKALFGVMLLLCTAPARFKHIQFCCLLLSIYGHTGTSYLCRVDFSLPVVHCIPIMQILSCWCLM